MRCRSCGEALDDFEATRRYESNTEEFLELCTSCSKDLKINTVDRVDLMEDCTGEKDPDVYYVSDMEDMEAIPEDSYGDGREE